jgi:hypothetical protein
VGPPFLLPSLSEEGPPARRESQFDPEAAVEGLLWRLPGGYACSRQAPDAGEVGVPRGAQHRKEAAGVVWVEQGYGHTLPHPCPCASAGEAALAFNTALRACCRRDL